MFLMNSENGENCDFAEKEKEIEFCVTYCSVRWLNPVLVFRIIVFLFLFFNDNYNKKNIFKN